MTDSIDVPLVLAAFVDLEAVFESGGWGAAFGFVAGELESQARELRRESASFWPIISTTVENGIFSSWPSSSLVEGVNKGAGNCWARFRPSGS